MLLVQDARLPSLTSLVAGEPVRGSWWGHARSGAIYDLLHDLLEDPDVLDVPLVEGKRTLVARPLFEPLAVVVTAGEPWQVDGLSPLARWLADEIGTCGRIRMDAATPPPGLGADGEGKVLREAARELARRLLVHATDEHTERGRHERVLEAWPTVLAAADIARGSSAAPAAVARARFEAITAAWTAGTDARARLPWQGAASRGRRRA
jgi:hypothetical protein